MEHCPSWGTMRRNLEEFEGIGRSLDLGGGMTPIGFTFIIQLRRLVDLIKG